VCIASVIVLDKVQIGYSVYGCDILREMRRIKLSYSRAFWNISDLSVECKDCGTINTITIESGELKKQI
jgi:hypothetical protein